MPRNLFEPAAASLDAGAAPSRPGKPVAVWIWMVVGSLAAALVVVGLIRGLSFAVATKSLLAWVVPRGLIAACKLAAIVGALIETQRRTRVGRVLGLICIAAVLAYLPADASTTTP